MYIFYIHNLYLYIYEYHRGQEFVSIQVIDMRKVPTTVILPNGHCITQTLNDSLLCPYGKLIFVIDHI